MHLLKTIGLFLLLVITNAWLASSHTITQPDFQQSLNDFQLTEDHKELAECILISFAEIEGIPVFNLSLLPEQLCPRKVSRAGRYLIYSRTIVPSLGLAEIIFPFHTFL